MPKTLWEGGGKANIPAPAAEMAMAVTKYAGNLECPDSRFAIDSPACDGVETLVEEF
jgi:hypothetical protein